MELIYTCEHAKDAIQQYISSCFSPENMFKIAFDAEEDVMLQSIIAILMLSSAGQADPTTCLGINCDSTENPFSSSYHWGSGGSFTPIDPLFQANNQCTFSDDCPGRTPEQCREHCDRYMESLHRGCSALTHWWDRMICRQQANEEYARCLRNC